MNILKSGFALLIFLLFASFGCAPQAEFIKLQDELNTVAKKQNQLQQRIEVVEGYLKERTTTSQKGQQDMHRIIADLGVKMDQLSTDIQIIQGKLEENNHRISELSQRLDDQAYKIKELSAKAAAAEAKPSSSQEKTAAQEKGKTSQNPSEVYNRAYQDYVNGNYDLALTGFQAYLIEFPDATLAPNAQYWIGECYYGKQEYKKAIDAFDKISTNYSKSEKIAASLLKAGFAYLELKDKAKAKAYLKKVVDQFPNTKEASLAKGKLATIK